MDKDSIQLVGPDQITLPGHIAELPLTLAEIGAVAVLACMEAGTSTSIDPGITQEMTGIIKPMREKGILAGEFDGKTLRLTVDLEAARN